MSEPAPQPPPLTAPPSPPPPTLEGDAPALASVLATLRARAAGLERTRSSLLGLATASLGILVAVGLIALKQEWGRPVGIGIALMAAIAGVVLGRLRSRRALSDDDAAARALGTVSPAHASDLLSAVQLAREASTDPRTSQPLVRAHLSRVGALARTIDARPALPARPVKQAFGMLALTLALHGLVAFAGGQRLRDAYRFLALGDAALNASLFAPEPIAGDVTITYRYPAYMNRPARTVEGTAGDLAAPKGTVIELYARADRDVAKAFAVIGSQPVALQVKGRELSGTWLLDGPGEWRLRYAKENGRIVAEGPARPITLEPDQFPEVKLAKPAQELEVEGKAPITLEYAASDDYGLSQLELVYSFGNGAAEQRKKLAAWDDVPRRQRGDLNWDLSALDLKPGDRVSYRLEVVDNDTVSGPKKGVSATQVLRVFSETEHHREILKKAEELWERLVGSLGDRLEERSPGEKGEHADEAWSTATSLKDTVAAGIAADMKKLARELALDKRAPPEIGRALGHVGERVGSASQKTSAARQALVKTRSQVTARAFLGALVNDLDEHEKGVLYLEDLIDRQKLLDLAELARELQQGREELKRLVEQYKKAPSEEAKQRLLGEVARLKERLADIYKRMRELQKGIQDEHVNEDADRVMQGGEDMMRELDEIQQQLAKGDADKALESLEKLQKSLDEMEKSLREKAGETDEETRELTRKLQQMASDLVDLQAEQKQLRDKTEALRTREKEAQQKRVAELGKQFLDKQKERVKRARDEIKGVDDESAQQLGLDDDLMGADDRLAQLEQALDTKDFDEALEQVKQASRRTQTMKERLDLERDTARRFPGLDRDPRALEDGAQRLGRASQPIKDVQADLEKLMRSARQPPTDAERQQMRELSQKQSSLQKRTEQLQKQLDQIGQQMPIFGPEQGQMLKDAAGRMGEAGSKLGEGEPRGASGKQQDALQKLQAFKEAMQQHQQSQQGSGGGGVPMPFGSSSSGNGGQEGEGDGEHTEKVEIPGADQDRAPAQFREELLKAMKDETPERFKERVRDYYQELVK